MISAILCAMSLEVPKARGAVIDESAVRAVVKAGPSLRAAFRLAHTNLAKGIATRIVISPGTYREEVTDLDWSQGKAASTPLVIEGKGKVVWTGADTFPLNDWKREGDLWVHSWPYQWGNFGYSWSAKGLIAHRSELAFFNGKPLRPRILETYEVTGIVQHPVAEGMVGYDYRGLLDPSRTLRPGEFGVTERPENGAFLYVRLPEGVKPSERSFEVAVRRNLLDLAGKSNVVLRNIEFTRVANDDGGYGTNNALRFSTSNRSTHVLIDRCRLTWCAQTGLHIDGDHWTIRDSEFSYNGGSGIAAGKSYDVRWQRNKTNFNVWRLWRGGELGYYTGGFKMHETARHTVEGHEAIGNCTMGAWWDVHCRDVRVRDLVAIGNAANLQFELCEGPFIADRLLLAGGLGGDGQIRLWEHGPSLLRNSILYSNYKGDGKTALYNLRWFGRDDMHSRMAKITAGVNRAERNVFVAGPNVPNFGMIDDIRGAEWFAREPMSYRGTDNVFSRPGLQTHWIKDEARTAELAARAISVDAWRQPATYSEIRPRAVERSLIDPANHDYRFSPSSPLYSLRGSYPQVRLSAYMKRQWEWFIDWSGFNPDMYHAPSGD